MATTKRTAGSGPRKASRGPTAEIRTDAWESDEMGFGTSGYDKSRSFTFRRLVPMTAQAAMDMFHGDDLAAKCCSALPENALRQGFDLVFPEDETGEVGPGIKSELDDLEAPELLERTASFARGCGGAGVYVGALDGGTPEQPLVPESTRDVLFLNEYDRRELEIAATYANRLAKNYGKPARFRLYPSMVYRGSQRLAENENRTERSTLLSVDASRMLMFGGIPTARQEKQGNGGWDYSVLDRIKDVLREANTTWHSIGYMMLDAGQSVWKIAGLKGMVDGGKTATITRRMRLIERGRSVTRAVIIGDGEEFSRVPQQFAGLDKIAHETWTRLASAADMPVTVLIGMSPAGLNATGESDIKLWYDRVQRYRRMVLQPAIVRLVVLLLAKRGLPIDTKFEVVWPSLWLESPKEQADRRKTVADTDAVAVDKLGVLPEEVALSRFRDDGWNAETRIDRDSREEIVKAKRAKAVEAATKPPEPPPVPPGMPGGPPIPGAPPVPGVPTPGSPSDEERAKQETAELEKKLQKAADDEAVARLLKKRTAAAAR